MSPFDPNLDNDAGHAIDQDDLIAFHLHELSGPQERALHRVLQNNPALLAESLAIASTLRAFPKHEPTPANLDPTASATRIWQSLQPNLTPYIPAATTPFAFLKLPLTRWAIPTLTGALLATTALILTLHHNQPIPSLVATNTHQPTLPTTAAPTATPTASSVPNITITLPSTAHGFTANPTSNQPTATTAATISAQPAPAASSIISVPSLQKEPTSSTEPQPSTPTTAAAPQPAAPAQSATLRRPNHPFHQHTTDITIAAIGNLTPDRSFTSIAGTGADAVTAYYTQETTPAAGALLSFHQQLRPLIGYRITASHSEPSFEDDYSASNSNEGNIIAQHVYELSGTYVVEGPHHHRLSTAAEAGAGLLVFQPVNALQTTLPVGTHIRPAAVFGASAELALTKHWSLHAGYRALLYKAPTAYSTFGSTVPPAPTNLTLSSEPVIGLTYRFIPHGD